MLNLTVKTNKGKHTIFTPESWDEVSVDQYLRILTEWDGEDWIQLFSILSGLDADYISQSTNGQIETALYQSIEFVFKPFYWSQIPIPEEIDLTPIWTKDSPMIPPKVKVPKNIGRLSIGQNLQARKSLEGVKDLREGMSIVTAIYLQPLIDRDKFDMLRVTELEYLIGKNRITKIYPIGFFLLRRLNSNGNRWNNVLRLLKQLTTRKGKR